MSPSSRSLPENTSIVIPRLFCASPAAEVDFCRRALGAVSLNERPGPDGTLAHALLQIGPAMIMIEAEWPSLPSRAPAKDGSATRIEQTTAEQRTQRWDEILDESR